MSSLLQRDGQVLWHPATHFSDLPVVPTTLVQRAQGCWLYPESGPPILDAISSWWTCIHGHGCPELVETLRTQGEQLDHVMFAGFTHRSAIDLASDLLDAAPAGYERVFFSDCGSASVEVALKIAYQYHAQSNAAQRRRFCALEHSYHGETLGALSVCGPSDYRNLFSKLLPDTLYLPSPHRPQMKLVDQSASPELALTEQENAALARAKALFEEHGTTLAALIVEPIVQCAGKFRMHSPGYLKRLCALAKRYGILTILDEIAVGFGRCETLFASQWAEVQADFMCLSKGLSGGIMPLAATLITEGISNSFDGEPARSFLHSHTYCGNPLACAVGQKSLEMLREPAHQMQRRTLAKHLGAAAQELSNNCDQITGYRQCGTIVAFDLDVGSNPRPSRAIRAAALKQGVLLRPLNDVLYWMPPFTLNDQELTHLKEKSLAALREALS